MQMKPNAELPAVRSTRHDPLRTRSERSDVRYGTPGNGHAFPEFHAWTGESLWLDRAPLWGNPTEFHEAGSSVSVA